MSARTVGRDAGIVHQHVEPAETVADRFNTSLAVGRVGDVALAVDAPPPREFRARRSLRRPRAASRTPLIARSNPLSARHSAIPRPIPRLPPVTSRNAF